MTIFVSQGSYAPEGGSYVVGICGEVTEPHRTAGGVTVMRELIPMREATFRMRPMPLATRQLALQSFKRIHGRRFADAYYAESDVLTDPTAIESLGPSDGGGYFNGFRPENSFGIFDTENRGPDPSQHDITPWNGRWEIYDPRDPDNKIDLSDLYERELRACSDFGREYIEITAARLPAPWENYDLETGPGKHDRIAKLVELTGKDPAYVIAYEKQKGDEASKGVISRMEDMLRASAAAEDEAARFVAPIPGGGA